MAKARIHNHSRSDVGQAVAMRVLVEWLITGLITLTLVTWLALFQATPRADAVIYDNFSRLMPAPPSDDILVIEIDDRSLTALGPWPWSRQVHADLIDRLAEVGTGPIAYDVLFIEPKAEDTHLARAMQRAGNVHIPALLSAPGMNGAAYNLQLPSSAITDAAASLGHVMLTSDQDGTVRHLPLWLVADDQKLSHLVLPLARQIRGADAFSAPDSHQTGELVATQQTLIRYPSPEHSVRIVSFIDVINGEIAPEFLHNRLVLVGANAQGMGDRYATSIGYENSLIPGVEIQAALLQTLIEQSAPKALGSVWRVGLSVTPIIILLLAFLNLRPAANTVVGICLLVLTIGGSFIALRAGWWWSPMPAIIGFMIIGPLWSWRRLAAAYRYMQDALTSLQTDTDNTQLAALSAAPGWRSGDVVSRQVHALDTALKQLRDFNRFITQSVRSLPDAAVIADVDGKVLVANKRANQLFTEDLLKDASLADLFQTLGQADWHKRLSDAPNGLEDINLADGRALQVATAPLTDANDQPAGSIVRFADVTLIRSNERQRERTLQLLGHDMRAPQVSILTLLDSANRPADFEKRIRTNARQTLSLADGYVQLARAESQPLRFALIDMAQLMTEATDMMWPQAAAKGVDLSSQEDGLEYLIDGDAPLLRRVLINLLDNAIRHTPSGGRVRCDIFADETAITVTVADEGAGFDPDIKSRMFQPFQGGNIAGSGLGLAFVHTVIQRHGGTISLDAPLGLPTHAKGSCFYIRLPVATELGSE